MKRGLAWLPVYSEVEPFEGWKLNHASKIPKASQPVYSEVEPFEGWKHNIVPYYLKRITCL